MMKQWHEGTVAFFDVNGGFGFITSNTHDRLFSHISEVARDVLLRPGLRVSYEVGTGKQGRAEAQVVVQEED